MYDFFGNKSVVHWLSDKMSIKFSFPPYGPMLMKRKLAKDSNFRQSLYNVGRDPPRRKQDLLEWICYVLSEEMSFEIFSPISFPC